MSNKPFTDVIRQVGIEGEEVLTVRPWPDSPITHVELCTIGAGSIAYWGPLRITLPNALAAELGRALISASGE